MSESWKERTDRYRNDPTERASAERAVLRYREAEPVTAAYWQAILNGDENTARKILVYRDIFKLREQAKGDRVFADLLAWRIAEVRKIQAAL